MSIDELQQVRDANPVARAPEPPPLAQLAQRLDEDRSRRRGAGGELRSRRGRVTIGAAAMAALAAAFSAFVLGAGSDPQATAAQMRSGGLLLGDYFAPFRAPAQGDQPDNPFRKKVPGLVTVDPASARRVAVPGVMLWVAADDTQVCISARSVLEPNAVRGACARPAQILDDGLFLTGSPSPAAVAATGVASGASEIAGLLPDGVNSVSFTLADRSRHDVAVVDNGIAATLPSRPQSVTFRDRDNVAHSLRM
jgi:hypothetical protein